MWIFSSHRQWRTSRNWDPSAQTATWYDSCSTNTTLEWTCARWCPSPTATGSSARRWRTTSRWRCVWRVPSVTPASPSSLWRTTPGARETCKPPQKSRNSCKIAAFQILMKPFVSETTFSKFTEGLFTVCTKYRKLFGIARWYFCFVTVYYYFYLLCGLKHNFLIHC